MRDRTVAAEADSVSCLNLLAMMFARQILHGVTALVFQVLGAVLGVLQIALAVKLFCVRCADWEF